MDGQPPPVGDNESFVRLIQVATEDAALRKQLVTILSQDNVTRQAVLNRFLADMRTKGAPAEFIDAMSGFLDDAVAECALETLRELK